MIRKTNHIKTIFLALAVTSLAFVFGCASAPRDFDPNLKGAQLIVDPECISLGVARVLGTPISFKGKGFKPGDSVFISLLGVEKGGKKVDVPLADAAVDKDGSFVAKVATLSKVTEILRADMGSNAKNENIVIISKPPIPEGTYTARAVSMESDIKADTTFTVKGPSVGDGIKDWLGGLTGKIVKK